jgi:hypothetical protein
MNDPLVENLMDCYVLIWARGGAVVEALRYKLEGHRIDSQ